VARSNSNTAIANAYIAKARVLAAAGALEQVWLMPDEQRYSAERHYNKVRHRGDIPLIGPLLNGVDSIVATEGTRARAVRDPAGARTAQPIVIQPAETLANPTPYSPAPADGPASNPANAAPRQ
jgi:outer membrane protein